MRYKVSGDFENTLTWLQKLSEGDYLDYLEKYAQKGLEALRAATPKRSGLTADSWGYRIDRNALGSARITWLNSNVHNHLNVAILIQYGHGTRNGGYVEGIDYINPALQPIFQQLADELWEEVTSVGRKTRRKRRVITIR